MNRDFPLIVTNQGYLGACPRPWGTSPCLYPLTKSPLSEPFPLPPQALHLGGRDYIIPTLPSWGRGLEVWGKFSGRGGDIGGVSGPVTGGWWGEVAHFQTSS